MYWIALFIASWLTVGEDVSQDDSFLLVLSPLSTADDLLMSYKLLEDKEAEVTLSEINFREGLLENIHVAITSETCHVNGEVYDNKADLDFTRYPIIMVWVAPDCQSIGIAQSTMDNFSSLIDAFGLDGTQSLYTWDGGLPALEEYMGSSR